MTESSSPGSQTAKYATIRRTAVRETDISRQNSLEGPVKPLNNYSTLVLMILRGTQLGPPYVEKHQSLGNVSFSSWL